MEDFFDLIGLRFEEPADQGSPTPEASATDGGGGESAPDGGGDAPADTTAPDTDTMDDLIAMTDSKSEDFDEPEPDGSGQETDDTPPADESADSPQGEKDSDTDEPEYNEAYDPNDLIEVDGEQYFYHPEEHAPEGTTQANVFKNRDDLEMAWPHKVGRAKEIMEELNEMGYDVGAVDLPDWVSDPDNPESLEEVMDVEQAIQWDNEELRNRSGEADKLISYLQERKERVSQKHERSTKVAEIKDRTEQVNEQLSTLVDELGIQEVVQTANSLPELRDAAVEARDDKIAEELKPLVDEYQDYKKDTDARLDDENYADNLERKRERIDKRRSELEEKYNDEYLSPFEEAIELEQEAQELAENKDSDVSEQQRLDNMNEAFMDLQREKQDDHPMFMSSDSQGVDSFRRWAVQRAEKFGGLQKTHQWYQALKAFDKHIEERRAEIRKQQVEDANEKEEKKKNDMPGYGDQDKIKSKDMADYEKDQAELNDLAEETDAKIAS